MTEQTPDPLTVSVTINPTTGVGYTSPLSHLHPTGESVETLAETMHGTWMVWTLGSAHLWDIRPEGVWWTRLPGAGRSQFVGDADAQRLTRVERWPAIDGVHFLWFDDPATPWAVEQWRQSSTVRHIERVDPISD